MVQLSGKYDSSNLGNIVGTAVQHSLTRDGSGLKGYEITSDGTRSSLSLQRLQ